MLVVAGLLEGFGRQLITRTPARYARRGLHRRGWGTYFYRPTARAMSAAGAKLTREMVTPEGVDLALRLAEAGERAAAFLLDILFMVLALVA